MYIRRLPPMQIAAAAQLYHKGIWHVNRLMGNVMECIQRSSDYLDGYLNDDWHALGLVYESTMEWPSAAYAAIDGAHAPVSQREITSQPALVERPAG